MKQTQRQKVLELLKSAGTSGINSHDLTYIHGIKQAPTRVSELKLEGYAIETSPQLKNKSVIYKLVFIPEELKKIVRWEFVDNKATPVYE